MEGHTTTNNSPSIIKIPLQSTTKTGRPIFAYMRRSTTKKEQASSLPQQEEGIELIAKALGINYSDIVPYTESRSGYENRTRKEWQRMLCDIDKSKEPCTILCRDTSRLSRNPTDNLAIANRVFGDNKHKKSIGNIYYLGENFAISEWNEKTNKKHIVDTLHQNYTDSMENKEKCIAGILLKLNMGEFPYTAPHGLSRVNKDGIKRTSRSEKTTLKQNEKMSFVRHAFEMKAKGRTAKEICKYLKQHGRINISTKNIVETLIGNTVYKGIYTEKTTGTYFENIKFWEGKPPIDSELWEKANAKVGKRGHGFGEGQVEHIAQGFLKHESGKSLYLYKAKGKYNAYQTEIKGEDGKRKSIGIMEKDVISRILKEAVPKILSIYIKMDIIAYLQASGDTEENQKSMQEIYGINASELFINHGYTEFIKYWKWKLISSKEEYKEHEEKVSRVIERAIEIKAREDKTFDSLKAKSEYYREKEEFRKSLDTIRLSQGAVIKDIFLNEDKKAEQVRKDTQKKELEQKKQALEEEKKNIDKKAFKSGFTAEFANEMKQDTEREIQELEEQINLLSESSDIEQYLDRLPEILLNLHELSSKVLTDAEYSTWRTDIKQLIEITLHELTLTNKKELKVKLSEVLENLENGKMGNGAINTAHTRTAIKEFVENYDRVKEKYAQAI